MKIRAGYEISYECSQPTPMILTLTVHPSRIPDLLTPDQMRLDLIGCPNQLHAGRRDPHLFGHRTHAPASPIGRRLGRSDQHLLPFRVRNRRFAAPAGRLFQARQAQFRKTALPTNDDLPIHADGSRRLHLTAALGSQQNNPRSARQSLLRSRCIGDALQLLPLISSGWMGLAMNGSINRKIMFCLAFSETLH